MCIGWDTVGAIVERTASIPAVSIDMNSSYEQALRAGVPQAEICLDSFHVVVLAGRAVDDVRRGGWNQAVSDAIALTRAADGAIVVARVGISQRGSLSGVGAQLRNVDANVPGVAVNEVVDQDYGYGYRREDNDDEPQDSDERPGWFAFSSREGST